MVMVGSFMIPAPLVWVVDPGRFARVVRGASVARGLVGVSSGWGAKFPWPSSGSGAGDGGAGDGFEKFSEEAA
jgi:hypothetical protein